MPQLPHLDFVSRIEHYTAEHSNFDSSRDYISMSHSNLSVDDLVNQYESGFDDSLAIRLKCYKGYQMQKDLINRITAVFGDDITTDAEISAFNGIVRGPPDFMYNHPEYHGIPGDVKSVAMDAWLPQDKVPYRVFCQMQAYMLYSATAHAMVIYESRETGKLVQYNITQSRKVQTEIDDKFRAVVHRLGYIL